MTGKDVSREIKDILRGVDDELLDRIQRFTLALSKYAEFFDPKAPSRAADRIEKIIKVFAKNASYSSVDKLQLYAFSNFYRPDGEVRIAEELERIRKLMLEKADRIHRTADGRVKDEIQRIQKQDLPPRELADMIKPLQEFLALPGSLDIKNIFRQEIAASLAARNLKDPQELNTQPADLISRIALRDCTLETKFKEGNLIATMAPFDPNHYLTYALNVSLTDPDIADQAREWWEFTCKAFGTEGARRFYEFVGFMMVTRFPQPTEKSIHIIAGDPGSGKGTHLAAVESLLTLGPLTLYAKANPHSLTDPHKPFSRQSLGGKLALISGDLSHWRIHDLSLVNDLFGGEPFESEMKFHAPTNEIPIFKGLWASTLPVFKITIPGGIWRRILITQTNTVNEANRDNKLKPKLITEINGFFLNALIGLSYLVKNNWRFTGELSDDATEALWNDLADSVRVWADGRLTPEDPEVTGESIVSSTLDGVKKEIIKKENSENMHVIDELYVDYYKWAVAKQIEPVKAQTFSAWIRGNGFEVRKRLVEEGQFQDKRKYVVFATYDPNAEGSNEDSKNKLDADLITWETYITGSPLVFDPASNMFMHVTRTSQEKENDDHVTKLQLQVGRMAVNDQKPHNTGLADDQDSVQLNSETLKDEESELQHENVKGTDNPENSYVPVKYIKQFNGHRPGEFDILALREFAILLGQGYVRIATEAERTGAPPAVPLASGTITGDM